LQFRHCSNDTPLNKRLPTIKGELLVKRLTVQLQLAQRRPPSPPMEAQFAPWCNSCPRR
jgi:hypothetical protein